MRAPLSLRRAALRYGLAGFPVLPCVPRDKQPLGRCVPHGFKDASSDAVKIAHWWAQWPDANLGIVPGPAGFVVLDVDNADAARALLERFAIDVHTHPCTVYTARGWHLYFRYQGAPLGQPKVIPDVDVRSHVGFVLAPPSVHPSGHVYRWGTSTPVRQAPPLPMDVLRAITEPKPIMKTSALSTLPLEGPVPVDFRVARYVERLPIGLQDGGGRKRTAYYFAQFLTGELGMSDSTAWGHLRKWNSSQSLPLSANELRRKLNEATKRERRAA